MFNPSGVVETFDDNNRSLQLRLLQLNRFAVHYHAIPKGLTYNNPGRSPTQTACHEP